MAETLEAGCEDFNKIEKDDDTNCKLPPKCIIGSERNCGWEIKAKMTRNIEKTDKPMIPTEKGIYVPFVAKVT